MENTEKIISEMQLQLQQMKEMLERETIINDRLLRNAYRKRLGGLRKYAWNKIILAIVAMLCWLPLMASGIFSITFIVATEIMLALALIGGSMLHSKLPDINTDLITAAKRVASFKKYYMKWIYYGLPVAFIWFAVLCYDVIRNPENVLRSKVAFLVGAGVGFLIGGVIGIIKRRKVINRADETLNQIKELVEN